MTEYKCQCGRAKTIPEAIGCDKCMERIIAKMEKERIADLNKCQHDWVREMIMLWRGKADGLRTITTD